MAFEAGLAPIIAQPMKTLLIDDHPLFREGFAMVMASKLPGFELLQAGSLADALRCIDREPALDLVLLDLALPDSSGMQGLLRLREAAPQHKLVVLSASESPDVVIAALDAGAAGFIPKTSNLDTLLAALRVVIDGGVYLPDSMLHNQRPPAATGETLGLSPRQLDVLRLLLEGKPNKTICRELDLSESTVKTHLAAIFRKLDVSSRTQAVVSAARLGLRLAPAR